MVRLRLLAAVLIAGLFLSAPVSAQTESGVFIAPAGTGPKDPAGPAAQGLGRSMQDMGLVQTVLTVNSGTGFFEAMRGLARSGRKVDVLVIAGHGALDDPGIAFGPGTAGGIGPADLDVQTMRREIQDLKAGRRRQDALGQPTAAEDARIAELRARIRDIKALGEAMNPGARVLLINCDTGGDARGARFIQDMGYALLPHGGRVIASRTRTAVTDQSGWTMLLQRIGVFFFDRASGKSGYGAGDHILSGDFEFHDFGPRPLTLTVDASAAEVEPGESVTLTAELEDARGAGQVLWTQARTQQQRAGPSVQVRLDQPGTEEFGVEAWDDVTPRPAAVQAFVAVEVVALEALLDGPLEVQVGETATFTARTQGFRQPWHEWQADGGTIGGNEPTATATFASPGQKTVRLRVYEWRNPRRSRTVTASVRVVPQKEAGAGRGTDSLAGSWVQENVKTGSTRMISLSYEGGRLVMQSGSHRCVASGSGKSFTFTFPLRSAGDFGMVSWHDDPPPPEVLEAAAAQGLQLVWRMTVVSPDELRGMVSGIHIDWEDGKLTSARNGLGPFETVWRREGSR